VQERPHGDQESASLAQSKGPAASTARGYLRSCSGH
jgi:hypothetical protein